MKCPICNGDEFAELRIYDYTIWFDDEGTVAIKFILSEMSERGLTADDVNLEYIDTADKYWEKEKLNWKELCKCADEIFFEEGRGKEELLKALKKIKVTREELQRLNLIKDIIIDEL